MELNSYDKLVTAVKDVAEDTDTEFESFIDVSIANAEKRLQDELDLKGLSANTEKTTFAGLRTVFKPEGYRLTHNVFLVDADGVEHLLKLGSADYLRDYWPSSTETAQPRYFATDYDFEQYLLAPTPDAAYTLRIDAELDITPLSSTNQTNFFTSRTPNALYYATMVEQSTFMKAWNEMQVWDRLYANARDGLNNMGRRDRNVDGSSVGTAASGENKLIKE